MTSTAPEWFEWAVSRPRASHFADADGTRIHYASWNAGDTGKPGLLFLHGFLGHSHWWDFIAPFFTDRFRVYALDFSGMGVIVRVGCGLGYISPVSTLVKWIPDRRGMATGKEIMSFGGGAFIPGY